MNRTNNAVMFKYIGTIAPHARYEHKDLEDGSVSDSDHYQSKSLRASEDNGPRKQI